MNSMTTMATTISALKEQCAARGIEPPQKSSKVELVALLAWHSLREIEDVGWGMRARLSVESPMLCSPFNNLTMTERARIFEADNWIAEPKYFGCRTLITYHPAEGFRFFSRGYSEETFLPIDLSDSVLLPGNGGTHGKQYAGKYDFPFMLDGMIYSKQGTNKKLDNYYGESEQNYISSILFSPLAVSHTLQVRFPLSIAVNDCIYRDKVAVWGHSLSRRKGTLASLFRTLPGLPFEQVPFTEHKKEFYLQIVQQGGEGVVLKNLDKPYLPCTSRRRDVAVRLHPDMLLEQEDIEAFISGAEFEGSTLKALRMSVYFRDSSGRVSITCIGKVQHIPEHVRVHVASTGKLLRESYGRVLTLQVSNFDFSARRYKKVAPNWSYGFRKDKNLFDCILEEDAIRNT